ncbi:MAG: HD domain-containing protein [Fibrobacteraceae bacterium]|nr:HD domain-containing protein [Fibrobacteraceae bacterium]
MGKEKLFTWQVGALIAASLLINFLGAQIALTLHIPFFFDSIGTLIAASLGGFLPGMLVGFFSNAVNSIGDPITLYYGILSVLIAILATEFSFYGTFLHLGRTLLSAFPFAFIGGVLGSILTYLIYGQGIGEGISAPYAQAINANTPLGLFFSQLLADIAIDIPDKIISVLAVFGIFKVLPKKILSAMPHGYLFLKEDAASFQDIKEEKRKEIVHRLFSLRNKTILTIIFASFVLILIATLVTFSAYKKNVDRQFIETAKIASNWAESIFEGESPETYLKTGKKDEHYYELEKKLYDIRNGSEVIEYICLYQIRPDGVHVIFDLDTPEMKGDDLGAVLTFDKEFHKDLPALLQGQSIEPVVSNDEYGWLLSVYTPLPNESQDGYPIYIDVDIPIKTIIIGRYKFILQMISLLLGASLLICAAIVWYVQRRIIFPLHRLCTTMSNFAYDNEDDRKKSVQELCSLNINTEDEIEALYSAIRKTATEFSEYAKALDEKNAQIIVQTKQISEMQDKIIFTFASMVENRDENTGGHILRTAKYVRAIADSLFNQGKYMMLLTEKFRNKLFKSAPLHDVGKIKIPDAILNKPGKLTPEEFEIIKTHTTEGRKILQKVLTTTKDAQEDNYLSEAINMASYHHERWDGKGYPQGLKGKEIPLSARIMAVADVFDALISTRSYKKAISFDEAIEVIQEESGSHFDPEVVEAFLSVAKDVYEKEP